MLSIEQKRIGSAVVLSMTGRITLGRDAQQVEWDVKKLLDADEKKIIFDLAGVEHIDSTGVGIIVMCTGKLKSAGGELRLAGTRPQIEKIFKLTSLDHILQLYSDVAAANFN
jgi:anti-sigma B factor antagonist